MHYSTDQNNFRNKKYLNEMEKEFKKTFRAYHKYVSYKNKLENELSMSTEDREKMKTLDKKYKRNAEKMFKRIQKIDWGENNVQ